MATVNGLTAERMLAIEAACIIGGAIVLNDLILTKHDGSTIDAGNVRGPQGIQGPIGEVSNAALSTQLINTIELAAPSATVRMTMNAAADPGWLLLNGILYANAQSLYPSLWGKLPGIYKVGSGFQSPNMTQFFPICGTPGTTGGANTKPISQANLPAATIGINPPLTAVTIVDPGHGHRDLHGGGSTQRVNVAIDTGYSDYHSGEDDGIKHIEPSVTGITASVDIPLFQSANLGSGTPFDVTPAWVAFGFQIKAH
jgi:hypothetical protein